MEVRWERLTAAALRALAAADAIVVLPVAAIEQHGPHLPTMVDTRLGGEVAVRAAERAGGTRPVVVTPTLWAGISEHHMPFGGTLSLDFATFAAVVEQLCRSVARHGFQRILLLNSHGGNRAALQVIVDKLTPELGIRLVAVTSWEAAAPEYAQILERQGQVRHACEAETSMMLALEPALVDPARFEEARAAELSAGRLVYRWQSFAERTPSGAIGDPTAATAEKGERLLEAAAEVVAELLIDPELWTLPPA